MKSDLFGESIKSALSEPSDTKDMGLHRTPDHIRQFMGVMITQTSDDSIFDPPCGTAGFGFDSSGYISKPIDAAVLHQTVREKLA